MKCLFFYLTSTRELVTELKIKSINNVYFSSVDEYNPYCSKWGYCISYNLFGEEGPDQSKGAVQDGTRGQCRDDKDCTPWAPSCSPLGYCRYLIYTFLTTAPISIPMQNFGISKTSVPKKNIASAVVTSYCTCYTFFRNKPGFR